jgi:hypothetical protein
MFFLDVVRVFFEFILLTLPLGCLLIEFEFLDCDLLVSLMKYGFLGGGF